MFDLVLAHLSAPWPTSLLGDVESDARSWKQWLERLKAPKSPFAPGSADVESPFRLRDKRIRVAVEIVEFELSVEQPELPPQPWRHLAESRCSVIASGMFFAAVENIESGSITFQREGEMTNDFELVPFYSLSDTSKCGSHVVCHESCGSLEVVQGRCVVMPSYVELRMEDMRLKSGESAGRLSLLVFHLVNPLCKDVSSSATVSPTRQDWLFEATTGMLARAKVLPRDVQRSIESFLSNVGIPMDSDLTAEHS
ncbi:hypothetical protein ATCC90586_011562 [Pythium insidiosum]|nr:hypothetical protein ATCC90586_011562 [Pythium insidiosum]